MAFKLKNRPEFYRVPGGPVTKEYAKKRGFHIADDMTLHISQVDDYEYEKKEDAKLKKPLKGALPKKMGKFKHSDAPDAKGKFKSLSASGLASWLIKSRKGNLSRIISSLNQQIVFNRGKNPSYAKKMKTTQNIVRKRLGKKKA
tara:strand:- start:393 stop:824 length:432 start_codon:yes stop_codon:yes gene_type:complete